MKKTRLAIIGLGNGGRKCVEAIASDPATVLARVVRRIDSSPEPWLKAPAVTHISELKEVDAALICVPARGHGDCPRPAARPYSHRGMRTFSWRALPRTQVGYPSGRAAHKVPAIVGAGCDPGALSLFRSQFALLAPRGHTETSLHTGTSLHHTLAATGIQGVRKALATECTAVGGVLQRYVYVELEPSANAAAVEDAIVNDPLFLDEQTQVFAVPSIAALEETTHGVTLERRTAPAEASHASSLLEARYDEAGLAARMMLVAARSLPFPKAGAYTLLDLPPGALWGEQRPVAEKEWI
jgi:diaminopimelate dehydrogenase